MKPNDWMTGNLRNYDVHRRNAEWPQVLPHFDPD